MTDKPNNGSDAVPRAADPISDTLREQGVYLAYSKDPELKKYVDGINQQSLAAKEFGAMNIALLAGIGIGVFSNKAGLIAGGIGLAAGAKGMFDNYYGDKKSDEAAANLKGKGYDNLLAAGDHLEGGTNLMKNGIRTVGALSLASSVLPWKVPTLAMATLYGGGVLVEGAGYMQAQSGESQFNAALREIGEQQIIKQRMEEEARKVPAPQQEQPGRLPRGTELPPVPSSPTTTNPWADGLRQNQPIVQPERRR